jgi:hypothetical protein
MMPIVPTLLVAAIAFMSSAVPPATGGLGGLGCGPGGVSRFVFVHCTSTGQLSSSGLFLNRAQVRRHILQSKPCHAADLGYREIRVHVEARAGDVMAGAGGAAGPAPDVRHQPPGGAPTPAAKSLIPRRMRIGHHGVNARSAAV